MSTDPQCITCSHLNIPAVRPKNYVTPTCAAFPAGIPDAIWLNKVSHKKPYPGDHGVRYSLSPVYAEAK